jgi:hypothetical protein
MSRPWRDFRRGARAEGTQREIVQALVQTFDGAQIRQHVNDRVAAGGDDSFGQAEQRRGDVRRLDRL